MRKFDVKQADLTVEGHFGTPAFALVRFEPTFLEKSYSALVRYGLSVNDVSYGGSQAGSIAERHILLHLPRIAAGVKLSIAKQEIGFNDVLRLRFEDIKAIVISAFGAVTATQPGLKIAGFVTTLNVHGIVEGQSAIEFLTSFIGNRPGGLGPPSGGAIGFYYGDEGSRKTLSIVMDGSAIVPRGVYMRITAAFDGGQLSYEQLPDLGLETYRRVISALQLTTG